MRVFVLSTGRCGSTTFHRACKHIENFSSGHETKIGKLKGRVKYPDNHIEIDNRLSWFLGRLEKKYGNEPFYIHLKRNKIDTSKSFAKRYNFGIMRAYRKNILWEIGEEKAKKIEIARHYYNTVNSNIDMFLKDKTRKMDIRLETAKSDFKEFWSRIGAVGSLGEATREWDQPYKASDPARDPESEVSGQADSRRPVLVRAANKMVRIARKLPSFLRRA